jgi:hypothetical protein
MIYDRLGNSIVVGNVIINSTGTVVVVTGVGLGHSGAVLVYGTAIYGSVDWSIGGRFLWIRGDSSCVDWEIVGSGAIP